MQLGIHVNTFHRPTLEATLDAVVEHGLECVHFNFKAAGLPSLPERIDETLCDRIAEALRSRGLSMATLSGTFNMIHPDVAVRRDGMRRLEVIAESAGPLGTSVISLCTGTRDPDDMWRRHPANADPAAWQDLLVSMEHALEIAERHGLVLGIEPEVGNVIDSALKARRLLDQLRSSRLKVILDGANLFHSGQLGRMDRILDEAFQLLGSEIVLGHAKDLDRDGEAGQVPAGQGHLDYDRYLALFRKVGFRGPLILHSLEEPDVPGCVTFLRGKLAEIPR